MQFYKIEGAIQDKDWIEANNDRRVLRQNVWKLVRKTETYNEKNPKKGFCFVRDASDFVASFGVIWNGFGDLDAYVTGFLKALDLPLEDTSYTEITLSYMLNMLHDAERHDYIEYIGDVLEMFQLDKLDGRFGRLLDYDEGIIEETKQELIYSKVDDFLVRDSLLPELERIFAGNAKKQSKGHPVHYMIFTDDEKVRSGVYKIMLEALYLTGRISNKRYSVLSVLPSDRLQVQTLDGFYHCNIGGTVLIDYLGNDETEDDRASGDRDMIETLCNAMKKYRNQVLTIFSLPRECTKTKELFFEYLGTTTFVEIKEEFASSIESTNYLKMLAKRNSVRTDKRLFAMLDPEKDYLAPDLHELYDTWYDEKLKKSIYPQYKEIKTVKSELIKSAPKGSAYDELMEMVGLKEAKAVIRRALDYHKAQKLFFEKGMKTERMSMHMVFTGNPGTAKTTVARLFARIMKDNEILSKGRLIEVGRGDLVGKYVGWTAPTIQKKFEQAKGSVLFIDEAYSLVDDRDGSYGDEAINTIVQEMENHRKDVVVIFAGYPDKMEQFLQKNPGLRSRIAFHVPFADYDTDELCEIAELLTKKDGMLMTPEASDKMRNIFETVRSENDFGNGRYVRNILERSRMNQASRLLSMEYDLIRSSDLSTICAEDIEPLDVSRKEKRRIGF